MHAHISSHLSFELVSFYIHIYIFFFTVKVIISTWPICYDQNIEKVFSNRSREIASKKKKMMKKKKLNRPEKEGESFIFFQKKFMTRQPLEWNRIENSKTVTHHGHPSPSIARIKEKLKKRRNSIRRKEKENRLKETSIRQERSPAKNAREGKTSPPSLRTDFPTG